MLRAAIMGHMTHAIHIAGAVPTFSVHDRVRKAREHAGLTQTELAERAGMARSGLARIEQGKGDPRRSSLIALAFATGVDLDWLETGETPAGDKPGGGSEVRHQGIEPRTHWLRSVSRVSSGDDLGINRRALETAA